MCPQRRILVREALPPLRYVRCLRAGGVALGVDRTGGSGFLAGSAGGGRVSASGARLRFASV